MVDDIVDGASRESGSSDAGERSSAWEEATAEAARAENSPGLASDCPSYRL